MLWLLGGLALVVAAVTLWQALQLQDRLALAQDEQLAVALAALTQSVIDQRTLLIDAPAYLAAQPAEGLRRVTFRVSAMNGDWLAGDQGLPACPWATSLPGSGTPERYVAQLRGTLMRVAAAQRHVSGERGGTPVVVQAAAPMAERWPGWPLLWDTLKPLYAAAAAMVVVVWMGVGMALAWINRARAALDQPAETPSSGYDGPAELAPLVERVQVLYRAEHQWVDEQRRFLADASHQLRTPMAVLRTQLQAAMAGDTPAAEVLPQMLHTVDRAAGLADQLLSLTKLEQLKRRGELQPVDLRQVARDVVLEVAPLIAAKRIDFTLDEAGFHVPGDATMLGELVRNLLANAIHHAPAGGRVGIVLRQGAQRLELIVWDEGPGIDDAVMPRLFHPFAATRGGIGLGLSICRQIAGSMDASVELYNRTEAGKVIGVDAVVAWGQGP
ncbi:sensor histidine kinase N-terminal domain-containing protein [Aquincola sp. S2]|uniref:histidine kinase n=2 Tax=Pseudaquabacterium terrae TaxID=2732868 RepID=A0ABX2EP79_9BURK|nr:sensor histidine kinase [Aquabacterium terrae]NRF70433.1 sensor histidine kinase N-terminal domain-containing protein [Aquabacterium terrae]